MRLCSFQQFTFPFKNVFLVVTKMINLDFRDYYLYTVLYNYERLIDLFEKKKKTKL